MRVRVFCSRSVTLVTLAMLLSSALPAGALAAGQSNPLLPSATNPFSPGIPQSPAAAPTTTTPPVVVSTTPSSGNSSLSGSSAVAIGVGALVVLAGISFFIWRDARRRAPVRHRSAAALAEGPGAGRSGSKARTKPRKLSAAEKRRRKRGRAR